MKHSFIWRTFSLIKLDLNFRSENYDCPSSYSTNYPNKWLGQNYRKFYWNLITLLIHWVSYWKPTLCEKCPYSEFFWSAFSCVQTEHGEIFRISLYSVHMRENAKQNNSEHGHFLRSVKQTRRTKHWVFASKSLITKLIIK